MKTKNSCLPRFCKVRMGIAASFFVFAMASAQVNNEIKLEEVPINQAFTEIESKTGYHFFYKKDHIDPNILVTVVAKEEDIKSILEQLGKETGLIYEVVGKQIVVSELRKQTIIGLITDKTETPIADVVVKNKYDNSSAVTDQNGRFSIKAQIGDELEVSKDGYTTYSLPVYSTDNLMVMLFTKKEEEQFEKQIDEVVITGYQQIDPNRAAAAVEKIDMKNFRRRGNPDVIASMEGLAPSLVLSADPRKPGSKEFNIRGISTLSGNSTPLIVVDGFPFEGKLSSINPYEVASITLLKDAAAASIYGVKSSNGVIVITTKKGKRGKTELTYTSNLTFGEKPDLDYVMNRANSSALVDIQSIYPQKLIAAGTMEDAYSLINGSLEENQFYMVYGGESKNRVYRLYEELHFGRISQDQFDAEIARLRNSDNTSDLRNLYFQAPLTNQQNISMSGGGDSYLYRSSLNYTNELGTFKGSDNKKIIFDFVSQFDFNERLKLDLQTSFGLYNNKANPLNFFGDDLLDYGDIFNISSYDRLFDANGNPLAVIKPYNIYSFDGGRHPGKDSYEIARLVSLGLLDETFYPASDFYKYTQKQKEWFGKIQGLFSYDLTNDLTAHFGGQYMNTSSKTQKVAQASSYEMISMINNTTPLTYTGANSELNIPIGDRIIEKREDQVFYMLRGQLDYNKDFEKHHISAILGTEISSNLVTSTTTDQFGYNSESNIFLPIDKRMLSQPLDGVYNPGGYTLSGIRFYDNFTEIENRFFSAYGNFHYSFLEKYNLTGSARIDQSNLFATDPKYRYQPLWSLGVKWRLGQENFLKEKVDKLDLRFSYGVNGNTANKYGPFDIAHNVTPSYINDYQNGLELLYYKLKNLRWEKTKTSNVGLDTSLFKKKLELSLDWYRKNSYDLFADVELDGTLGGNNGRLPMNTASIINDGFEIISTYHIFDREDFKWDAFANYRFNKGKVTEAYLDQSSITFDFAGSVQNFKGFEPNSLMVFEFAGIDNEGYGLIRKADGTLVPIKDDPFLGSKFNIEDMKSAGSVNPKHVASFTNNFNYKNFGLSMLFVYQGGHVLLKDSYNGETLRDGVALIKKDAELAWQNPGDENFTDIPRISSTLPYSLLRGSTKNVIPGDFMRLRDVVLSYTIPNQFVERAGLQELTLNFRGSNLYLWTKNKEGIDPEAHGLATRYFKTPKTFTFGINLIF